MKRAFLVIAAALSLSACTSVSTATVNGADIASNGEAVAVLQANALGFTLFLHNVEVVHSDLDMVINKLLVAEAKALGANRVDLMSARTSPRDGIFSFPALLVGFPYSSAVGVAVK